VTSKQSSNIQHQDSSNRGPGRALLIGGGITALIAAETLKETGFHVTFVRIAGVTSHPYLSRGRPELQDYLGKLSQGLQGVEIIDSELAPEVRRNRDGFGAAFQDGRNAEYDCLFLAPGVSLKPKPQTLPDRVELFHAGIEIPPGARVAFLMDHPELSDPALGMSAIKAATENSLSGGVSVICFRHAPVMGMLGETILDDARKAGVRFIRFREQSPPSVSLDSATPEFISLAVHDMIDDDRLSEFSCERLFVVTGPDSSSIPQWAAKMSHEDLDDRGFLLSDSVHCASGCSWSSGVFIVGEATGNLDLLTCVAQARAAAAKAKAWLTQSLSSVGAECVSTSDACVRCLTCLRVCPHHAISLPEETSISRIEATPALCRECGICASVCPSVAIRLRRWPEQAMTGRIEEMPQGDIAQTVFVFGCEKSAGLMAESVDIPESVRFIGVPCAGSVSDYIIWSTLAAGAKGVLVVGCHNGNCASHKGTDMAASRVERVLSSGLLSQEAAGMKYLTVAANEPARFGRLLKEFVAGLG
jgi:quinone-modifying oxidoreductase, subunit QmoB